MAFYEGIFKRIKEHVIIKDDMMVHGRRASTLEDRHIRNLMVESGLRYDSDMMFKYIGVSKQAARDEAVFKVLSYDEIEGDYIVGLIFIEEEGYVHIRDLPEREFEDPEDAVKFFKEWDPSERQDVDVGDLE